MMAAITVARMGAPVVLLEKKRRLGIKLAITGKGRCNFTNATSIEAFIDQIPQNGRFLYSAVNAMSPESLIQFFEDLGVETKVERGGRAFPASDSAHEICAALSGELERLGVDVRTGWKVTSIQVCGSSFCVLAQNRPAVECSKVVVATGGITYPQTGSTGDGYRLLEPLGHQVTTPRPSLVPLLSKEDWIRDLQGLSLRNVRAALTADGKAVQDQFGEMLFTSSGLSGPIILTLSRRAVTLIDEGHSVAVLIDLKPALEHRTLDLRLVSELSDNSRKLLKNALESVLPRRLVPVVIAHCGIDSDKPCSQITKAERQSVVNCLKELAVQVSGYASVAEAIVTQGGVNLRNVDPSTMESRLIKRLHICGELLDIDGYTGGFNLHIAFATGYLAGRSVAY